VCPCRAAAQGLHKDITKQQFRDVKETAIHSAIATADEPAELWIQSPGKDKEIVTVPPFSMIFFHGRLLHAGRGYAKMHTRLHCYVGDKALLATCRRRPAVQTSPRCCS
jgi:hypothetical protein